MKSKIYPSLYGQYQLLLETLESRRMLSGEPTIGSLTSDLTTIGRGGAILLTANDVADSNGTVSKVEFYRDDNGNSTLDIGTDTKIGEDTSSTGGWTYNYTVASDTALGSVQFFARATDNDSSVSIPASISLTIKDRPTIASVSISAASIARLGTITVTANNVLPVEGTLTNIQFYVDKNNNSTLELDTDLALGTGTLVPSTDNYTLANYITTNNWPVGANVTVFARAKNSFGGVRVATQTIEVTNVLPTLASVASDKSEVGRNGTITLTASTPADADGTISKVEFYRDNNANGTFDSGIDTKISEDSSADQGWTATYTIVENATLGATTFFARAVDNDNAGTVQSVEVTVKDRPTIAGIDISPASIARGNTINLTAQNVLAVDGTITSVVFYLDHNKNGVIDAGDTDLLLGTATKDGVTDNYIRSNQQTNSSWITGAAVKILAKATNSFGGFTVANSTLEVTNVAPTLGSLTANTTDTGRGNTLVLTANSPSDSDGGISKIEFYRDANANGTFEAGTDTKIGEDTSVVNGWNLSYTLPDDFALGVTKFFARVIDGDSAASAAQGLNITVHDKPTITSVTTDPAVVRSQAITIVANGVTAGEGTLTNVQFYLDRNTNGVWDGSDLLLGTGSLIPSTTNYILSNHSTSDLWPLGNNVRIFARAQNSVGGIAVEDVTLQVTNSLPTIGSLTSVPTTVGQGQAIALTAGTVADADGTVSKVEFYIDTNANNTFDDGIDTKIGQDTTSGDGWTLSYTIPNNTAAGATKFFARATDDDGGISTAQNVTVTITSSLLIGSFPNPTAVFRGDNVLINVNDIVDPDNSTKVTVQFYLDKNNNGSIDSTDPIIGSVENNNNSPNDYQINIPTNATDWVIGTNQLIALATNSNGKTALATASVTLNSKVPTLGSLTADKTNVGRGGIVIFTANNAVDPDGTIARVEFYRDTNGNGTFDAGTDTKIGEDTSSTSGWTYTYTVATDADLGATKFFARAIDNNSVASVIGTDQTFSINIKNKPAIDEVLVNPGSVARLGVITSITAKNVILGDDSTLSSLKFYLDKNNNGTLETGTDLLLGDGTKVGDTNNYALNNYTTTKDWITGNAVKILVRVENSFGGVGIKSGTVTVTNTLPVVESLTASPTSTGRGNTILFTATNPTDADGGISKVEFYRDTNGNGTFDLGTDTKIGQSTSGTDNKWTLNYTVASDTALGSVKFFAVAVDGDNGISVAKDVSVTIAEAPIISALTTAGPVTRGSNLTLNLSATAETGNLAQLRFYYDTNKDGLITDADPQVGTVTNISDPTPKSSINNQAYSIPTDTLAIGSDVRIIAKIENSAGGVATRVVTVTINPANPTLTGAITVSAAADTAPTPTAITTIARGQTIRFASPGPGHLDPNSTVSKIEYYRNNNIDDIIDNADTKLGEATAATGWKFIYTVADDTPLGEVEFLAQAVDTDASKSTPALITVLTVADKPAIAGVTTSQATINRGDSVTFTAQNVTTPSGTITQVKFYADKNNNGTLETATDFLIGTVTSPNAGPNGYELSAISNKNWPVGNTVKIIAQATNSAGGTATATATMAINNVAPTLPSLSALPPDSFPGGQVILTASAALTDTDGTVSKVEFYRDTNGNNTLDIGVDTKLGEDTSATGGWTLTYSIPANTPAGTMKFFARATDNDGTASTVKDASTIVHALPVINVFTTTSPKNRGEDIKLTLPNLAGLIGGDLTKATVKFYLDLNKNGTVDTSPTDTLLGSGVKSAEAGKENDYNLTVSTAGWPVGNNVQVIAQVKNEYGGTTIRTAQVTINNNAPTLTGNLLTNVSTVGRGGVVILSLSNNPTDTDGTINRVEFYRQTGNGNFDANTAVKIGEDTSLAGGWKLNYTVAADTPPGAVKFFARAVDNNSGTSDAIATTSTITILDKPTIGTFSATASVVRNNIITLLAQNVLAGPDSPTITSVKFYLDLNKNGIIDPTDSLLGSGIRQTGTSDYRLEKSTKGWPAGTDTKIIAKAQDAKGAADTKVQTVAIVNNIPTINSVLPNDLKVYNIGSVITFLANVSDVDGTISQVDFYLDKNNNGAYESSTDVKLNNSPNFVVRTSAGWRFNYLVPADSLTGNVQYFAIAKDNDGATSATAAKVLAINAPPTIGSLEKLGSVARKTNQTLTVNNVVDTGGIAKVELFYDLNHNDIADPREKLLGTGVKDGVTNNYIITFNSTKLPLGQVPLVVKVTDSQGAIAYKATTSSPETPVNDRTTITFTNAAPTIGSLTTLPTSIAVGQKIRLTAVDVGDVDGSIKTVQFYRDADNSNTITAGDQLLGTGIKTASGWVLNYTIPNTFPTGNNIKLIARATDNEGGRSEIKAATITVN